ncbi:replication initiation protein [Bifidobacterium pseudocatenulatum]|jgi:plasmid replication initiation protein|uniref:replication initiation protein n=1 Tax=Bifidobacterium pseudocatenulatum TaxID=28026 RepID=UPI00232DBED0|nr:replication initiation protein [Bifidobacterium pseudocatenulatum]MDB6494294.1 replication initiation protein [Bifidobacterium pseudocatenulatum]MDB6593402.1 replication initiation protein [Bifidobacterium longum]
MSNEIVKFSNQFNNVALKKFDAVHLDVLMAIASRVREKGTATVEFSFEELRGLMRLRKNLTNKQLADKIVQTNARLLALNYMFEDSGKIIQFALFTVFETDPANQTLEVSVNERFAFLLNDLTSQFTRFELAEFADLKSKYAKEFYRRAKQYRSSGIWKVSRDEFCRLLNVTDSAKSTANLNRVVLKPIIEECGPLLGLKIERQYVKRRLSGFVFTFARETPPVVDAKPVDARKAEEAGHWTSVAGYGEVFTTTGLFDVTAARDHFDGTVDAGECRYCRYDARNRERHARNTGTLF